MTKPFKIWIEDTETFKKVLTKMTKEDITWMSGAKPLDNITYPKPIGLYVDTTNSLSYTDDYALYSIKLCNEITPEEYLKEDKTMTKADLKDWMIVEVAVGSILLVDKTHGYLINNNGHMPLSDYTDDLKDLTPSLTGRRDYSIVKVYEPRRGSEFLLKAYLDGTAPTFRKIEEDLNLIWERPEPVEMTVAEIEEKLGIKNLKIVKEDKDD